MTAVFRTKVFIKSLQTTEISVKQELLVLFMYWEYLNIKTLML